MLGPGPDARTNILAKAGAYHVMQEEQFRQRRLDLVYPNNLEIDHILVAKMI